MWSSSFTAVISINPVYQNLSSFAWELFLQRKQSIWPSSSLSASAFEVHCQQNVWHGRNWIPTTNYLRITVASISEKPVSTGLWKAVWQAVKPLDDQVRVQQYFCHKAKFSTPKWGVRFPCKSRSTTPVIQFLCKSFTAQVALVTTQKHSNCKEGFPFMI